MKPTVKVIAFTHFVGVPTDLWPNRDAAEIFEARNVKGQDSGSDSARLTECAGRTCYDSYGKGRSSEDFHKHILEVGHGSVLEHASISFYIAGISRGCSHELVRHRAGCAISQRSTRYIDESESDWCWHPLIERSAIANENVTGAIDSVQALAQQTYSHLAREIQFHLEQNGADKQTARKQARGAARGVLGNALETSMVWTANIRALRNVIEQRASEFADAEIRLLANAMLDAALDVCPEYFSDYEKVPCPDGIGYGVKTAFRKV